MTHDIVTRLREAAAAQEGEVARLLYEAASTIDICEAELADLRRAALAGVRQIDQMLSDVTEAMRTIGLNIEVLRLRETLDMHEVVAALKDANSLLTTYLGHTVAVRHWRHDHSDVISKAERLQGGSNG